MVSQHASDGFGDFSSSNGAARGDVGHNADRFDCKWIVDRPSTSLEWHGVEFFILEIRRSDVWYGRRTVSDQLYGITNFSLCLTD